MQYLKLGLIGERQHGLITRKQLMAECSRREIEHLIGRGYLERIRPAVYRFAGSEQSWMQQLMAIELERADAVVSHHAALYLHGVTDPDVPPMPEITLPPFSSARIPGVIVHRSDLIERIQVVDHLRVANVARSLIDVSHKVYPLTLEKLVEKALFCRAVNFQQIRREITLIAIQGRRGVAHMRELLDRFDPVDGDVGTKLERDVLAMMRRLQMPEPIPQYGVWLEGRQRFIDFAYPELKIGIEAHSVAWHQRVTSFEADSDRDGAFTAERWRMFYVTHRNMEAALLRVKRQLPATFVRSDTA